MRARAPQTLFFPNLALTLEFRIRRWRSATTVVVHSFRQLAALLRAVPELVRRALRSLRQHRPDNFIHLGSTIAMFFPGVDD
ncbi:hypothetical protein M6B38_265645 [Iris pallida]|uniref:Uncharacterized protein n=1 Tax=Iris pallida TaxID=29817 RepID=A0AAX6IAL0_IRIPA|nr:hypothetical protein M6B38_265645 [Iris pallida]